jgi:hypothetical protein
MSSIRTRFGRTAQLDAQQGEIRRRRGDRDWLGGGQPVGDEGHRARQVLLVVSVEQRGMGEGIGRAHGRTTHDASIVMVGSPPATWR